MIETFASGAHFANVAVCYAVLDSVVTQFGGIAGGWKVAHSNQAAMKRINTDAPAKARCFSPIP